MKTLSGHLTAGNKKAIKLILNAGLTSGRVNRTDYFITKSGLVYSVEIVTKDRGLIPCPGSKLRMSKAIHTFTLK